MSPQKRQGVLALLAEGHSAAHVSRELGVSWSTAKRIAADVKKGGDGQPKHRGSTGKGALLRKNSSDAVQAFLSENPETLAKMGQEFLRRLDLCINAGGQHFEI